MTGGFPCHDPPRHRGLLSGSGIDIEAMAVVYGRALHEQLGAVVDRALEGDVEPDRVHACELRCVRHSVDAAGDDSLGVSERALKAEEPCKRREVVRGIEVAAEPAERQSP